MPSPVLFMIHVHMALHSQMYCLTGLTRKRNYLLNDDGVNDDYTMRVSGIVIHRMTVKLIDRIH